MPALYLHHAPVAVNHPLADALAYCDSFSDDADDCVHRDDSGIYNIIRPIRFA